MIIYQSINPSHPNPGRREKFNVHFYFTLLCAASKSFMKIKIKIIKKESLAQVFSCEFCEIPKDTFFLQNTSGACFGLIDDTRRKIFGNVVFQLNCVTYSRLNFRYNCFICMPVSLLNLENGLKKHDQKHLSIKLVVIFLTKLIIVSISFPGMLFRSYRLEWLSCLPMQKNRPKNLISWQYYEKSSENVTWKT